MAGKKKIKEKVRPTTEIYLALMDRKMTEEEIDVLMEGYIMTALAYVLIEEKEYLSFGYKDVCRKRMEDDFNEQFN